jgi:1,4-alpha-glucan branching enzyme
MRKGTRSEDTILVVCNFTPVPRPNYRIGAPQAGFWKEILNSDAKIYGGSGQGNMGGLESAPIPMHGRHQSLTLNLPPLAVAYLKREGRSQ